MSNLTSVGVTSGQGSSGTGTVSTIDALMADGGQATLGAQANAASTATDTTPVTAMSVLEADQQIHTGGGNITGKPGKWNRHGCGRRCSFHHAHGQHYGLFSRPGHWHWYEFWECGALICSMRQAAGDLLITSVALEIDSAGLISGEGAYNLYLYNVTPPSALADGGAFDLPSGDACASWLGVIPSGTPAVQGTNTCVMSRRTASMTRKPPLAEPGSLATCKLWAPTRRLRLASTR